MSVIVSSLHSISGQYLEVYKVKNLAEFIKINSAKKKGEFFIL